MSSTDGEGSSCAAVVIGSGVQQYQDIAAALAVAAVVGPRILVRARFPFVVFSCWATLLLVVFGSFQGASRSTRDFPRSPRSSSDLGGGASRVREGSSGAGLALAAAAAAAVLQRAETCVAPPFLPGLLLGTPPVLLAGIEVYLDLCIIGVDARCNA